MLRLPFTSKVTAVICFCVAAIVLQGCTSSTGYRKKANSGEINYSVVGSFEDRSRIFEGYISVSRGGHGVIELKEIGSTTKCKGDSQIKARKAYAGVRGQSGTATIKCDDGLVANMAWRQTGRYGGEGLGQDNQGNKINYRFSLSKNDIYKYKKFLLANRSNMTPYPIATKPIKKPEPKNQSPAKPSEEQISIAKSVSVGTGFFISKTGHFITNFHVIKGRKKILVLLENGNKFTATILSKDPHNDIVIGKIDAQTTPIPILNGQLHKGEEVFALGYPRISLQGREQKATFGRINALSGAKNDIRYYQVDTPIQPGNSGGPLINSNGEVIGIVTASLNQSAALKNSGTLAQNVNYAIKSTYLLALVKSSMEAPKVPTSTKKRTLVENIKNTEESVFLVLAE